MDACADQVQFWSIQAIAVCHDCFVLEDCKVQFLFFYVSVVEWWCAVALSLCCMLCGCSFKSYSIVKVILNLTEFEKDFFCGPTFNSTWPRSFFRYGIIWCVYCSCIYNFLIALLLLNINFEHIRSPTTTQWSTCLALDCCAWLSIRLLWVVVPTSM